MPRALLGQPELLSVCGAERLEEWVLDVYVEGDARCSWVNRQRVPQGRCLHPAEGSAQFGGAHGRAALMMSPSYTRPPAPSYEARHAGPRGASSCALAPMQPARSISGLGIFDQKGLDVGRRAAWRTHR